MVGTLRLPRLEGLWGGDGGLLTYDYPAEQDVKKSIVANERGEHFRIRRGVDQDLEGAAGDGRVVAHQQLQVGDWLQLLGFEDGGVRCGVAHEVLDGALADGSVPVVQEGDQL